MTEMLSSPQKRNYMGTSHPNELYGINIGFRFQPVMIGLRFSSVCWGGGAYYIIKLDSGKIRIIILLKKDMQKGFPYRELNPGLPGESRVS